MARSLLFCHMNQGKCLFAVVTATCDGAIALIFVLTIVAHSLHTSTLPGTHQFQQQQRQQLPPQPPPTTNKYRNH